MLIIISPSKNLTEKPAFITSEYSIPEFLDESATLIKKLRTYSSKGLSELMDINTGLAMLNQKRYLEWSVPFTSGQANPAILMFNGEVYNGLKAKTLSEEDLLYAQDHLRILSGLHGILRPLDLMKPYRLEMGTGFRIGRHKNLYDFWQNKVTSVLNREIKKQKQRTLVNLASNEYFKVLDQKKIEGRIVQCMFKESVGDTYKFFTIYGKKARGLMTRFIIQNRIENVKDLKHFEDEGYFYNVKLSGKDKLVFTR
jgi:uncharacterized protein